MADYESLTEAEKKAALDAWNEVARDPALSTDYDHTFKCMWAVYAAGKRAERAKIERERDELYAGVRRRIHFAVGHNSDDWRWWSNNALQTLRWLDEHENREKR